MIPGKFIRWIISWIKSQTGFTEKQRKRHASYNDLQKRLMELEKLIDHMSAENDEIQAAFFRNLYHEIRTPMNSILGFSSLLHNENLTTEKRNIYTCLLYTSPSPRD